MEANTKDNWSLVSDFVKEMKANSKTTVKKEIIHIYKWNSFLTKLVEYTYDPFRVYHITSKTCRANPDLLDVTHGYANIFELLDDLNNRVYTGHDAIAKVNGYVFLNKAYEDLIFSVIDRNLEVRASEGVFNKVIPGWIPTFKPALANVYKPKLVDIDNETWYASRKLDGVRCLAIIDAAGKVELRSRQGQVFDTLDRVVKDIEALNLTNKVLDGEICICDAFDNEDFQAIMKEIRRKDHTIQNPKFKIFDCFSKDTFDNEIGNELLEIRLETASYIVESSMGNTLQYVEHSALSDDAHFEEWQDLARDNNWEGFMIRKNVGYEGKRSNNLLKVKTFHDAEYEVTGCDFREHRVIREGKEVKMDMLAQVFIKHKGYEVAVGSGFSQLERIRYHKNPKDIIGKIITVAYFEETQNQEGDWSLRFPTVKVIHGAERTT
jgi:DNA ligase-1